MRDVDAFLNNTAGLLDQFGVNDRKERREVTDDGFINEQNRNTPRPRVVQHVSLVFDVLDDRDQNARSSLPKKDAVNVGGGIAGDEILDLAIVVSEDDDRNGESDFAAITGGVGSIH